MKEDSNWFSNWEEELPSPDELMPLSQSLITPNLATAFDIRNPGGGGGGGSGISLFNSPQELLSYQQHNQNYSVLNQQSSSTLKPPSTQQNSPEFDSNSGELGCGVGGGSVGGSLGILGDGGDGEPARTLKRPRLVWTPQLHKRFVDAVAHLGIKNAVPKTIMTLMSVDGLTRENVASHLQKYRLYLKRMQHINNNGGGNGPGCGSGDSATDHLFASSPVPAHFLHNGPAGGNGNVAGGGQRLNSDPLFSYVPVAAVHNQQMLGHQQMYSHHQRQMGHFGLAQNGGGGLLDQTFLTRQAQLLGPNRNGMLHNNSGFLEDVESGNNGRKVLTLFPTADE